MEIKVLKSVDFEDLNFLTNSDAKGPFIAYLEVSPQQALNFWRRDIFEKLQKDKLNRIFTAKEEVETRGAVFIRHLDWDSRHFGFEMAEIPFCFSLSRGYVGSKKVISLLLSKALDYSRKNQVRHLTIKVEPKEMELIGCLQEEGFKLVAVQATYSLELDDFKTGNKKPSFKIRSYENKDWVKMSFLAKEAFSQKEDWLDRFHADNNLPEDKADELYLRWFENCVKKKEADEILVAEINDEAVGFICFKLNKDINESFSVRSGSIVLNAVSYAYRRRGVYTALVKEALEWFKKKGVSVVTITTQMSVVPVRKVWQNLGAHLAGTQLVFHKYLKSGGK